MEKTKKPELSASNMKNALWETLQQVKDGTMQPGQADSVATAAREILRATTVQLKVAAQTNRPVSAEVIAFAEK